MLLIWEMRRPVLSEVSASASSGQLGSRIDSVTQSESNQLPHQSVRLPFLSKCAQICHGACIQACFVVHN